MSATTTTPTKTEVFKVSGTLMYPNIFTARVNTNAKPGTAARYGCMIVLKKGGPDVKALQQKAIALAVEKIGKEKVTALLKDKKLNIGIRYDLVSKKIDDSVYEAYIQPWSADKPENKPGVVSRYRGADGKPIPITNPRDLYSGCQVSVSVRPFYYDRDGNKGIGWGLGNVQKIGEGERLSGNRDASDEFEATEDAPLDMPSEGPSGQQYSGSGGGGGSSSSDDLADLLGG